MPKKCKKTRKTRFPDEKKAGRAKMRIWSHDPSADMRDLHTYQCEFCKGWHVGHLSYYQMELAKKSPAHIHQTISPSE